MLCSADSSHSNGRYWIREPEYGLIANPTRSTMNDSTYKTCIWKKKNTNKQILDADHYTTNLLTGYSRVLLEKLMATQLLKKFPPSYTACPPLLCSREHTTGTCAVLSESYHTSSRYRTDNADYHCYRYLRIVTRLLAEHLRNQSSISGRSIRTPMGPRSLLLNGYWGITAQG